MTDSSNVPIVRLNSDARNESADWIEIQPFGSLENVVNVVGYDEGIDPKTLCPTKIFIVTGHLGKKFVHYTISAENFLQHMVGIYDITKVSEEVTSTSLEISQSTNGKSAE